MRNLERAEDISGAAMAAGIDWTWSTFAEYLDAVDRQPKSINYAANLGHSALRTFVMGERAFEEEAGPDDLKAMAAELEDALRAGAYGFTTSRTEHHRTSDDRPVASRLASWAEVEELVGVLGPRSAPVSSSSCRTRPRRTIRTATPAWSTWPCARACRSPSAVAARGPSG